MGHSSFRRYSAIAMGVLLASTVTIHPATDSTSSHLTFVDAAAARSSGGRSGGGSFRSSPSRSSSSSSSGSSSSRSSGSSSSFSNSPSYSRDRSYNGGGGTVIVPVPVGPNVYNDPYRNSGYSNRNSQASTDDSNVGWVVALILIGVSAIVVFGIVFFVFKVIRSQNGAAGNAELDNNTVTVSKIQVALLAEAREIQSELTDLSLDVDTETSEGLLQLVQEAALALLRMPENWSHVLADSQTVKSREAAEALFNKLSITERSKFSVETLTNVGGRVHKRDHFKPDPEEGPASYIVVTLLVGTAHDKPLFDEVRTSEALSQVLEQLASLPSDYLMTFELLWSPQEASDSLTYDELLTEYTDMVQL